MLVLYIFLGLIIFLVLLSLFYVRLQIALSFNTHPEDNLSLKVTSRFYDLQRSLSLQDLYSLGEKHYKKEKHMLSWQDYLLLGDIFLKHLVVEKFEWKSCIGMSNAMYTALCVGSVWAVKGMFTGFLSSRTTIKILSLDVKPDFDNEILVSHINCILKMRIVHIIHTTLFFLLLIVRRYIYGWTTTRKNKSSYRRLNENRYASY